MHVERANPIRYHGLYNVNENLVFQNASQKADADRSIATSRVYERTRIYTLAGM